MFSEFILIVNYNILNVNISFNILHFYSNYFILYFVFLLKSKAPIKLMIDAQH